MSSFRNTRPFSLRRNAATRFSERSSLQSPIVCGSATGKNPLHSVCHGVMVGSVELLSESITAQSRKEFSTFGRKTVPSLPPQRTHGRSGCEIAAYLPSGRRLQAQARPLRSNPLQNRRSRQDSPAPSRYCSSVTCRRKYPWAHLFPFIWS